MARVKIDEEGRRIGVIQCARQDLRGVACVQLWEGELRHREALDDSHRCTIAYLTEILDNGLGTGDATGCSGNMMPEEFLRGAVWHGRRLS